MNSIEQKKQAKAFVERWTGKGYEKGESQRYWIDLLSNVLGVQNATEFIEFEDQVHIDKATGFIDAYIPSTKIIGSSQSRIGSTSKMKGWYSGLKVLLLFAPWLGVIPLDDLNRWFVSFSSIGS